MLQEQQYRLFDLEKGPLYRFGLIRLNENRWIWFWFFHHIIMDGMGLANLLERLVFLYENPEHEDWEHTQFIEFAAEEIAYKKSENWKKDKTFWSDYLSDSAAPVSFSSKQHQPINLSISSITKEFLSVVESQAIKQLCKEYRITTYSFFAAAMVLYIHRLTGACDVCIGCPTSFRPRKFRSMVGMSTNVIPLRIQVNPNDTFIELARKSSIAVRKGLRHSRYPLSEIVNDRRAKTFAEPFLIDVNYETYHGCPRFGKAEGSVITTNAEPTSDLSLFIFDKTGEEVGVNNEPELRLSFNAERYERSDVEFHLRRFKDLVIKLPNNSFDSISTINILSSMERHKVWLSSCGPLVELDPNHAILSALFDAQAEKTPDAIALVYEDASLSYGALASRSNQLARYLIERGVGPDTVIAILMHRSVETVATLLGILKAGAAYLPLDPEYPVQRLGSMLESVKPSVIMTTHDVDDVIGVNLETYWGERSLFSVNIGSLPNLSLIHI